MRHGQFANIDGGAQLQPGHLSAVLGTTYQHEPLTLTAPSPDPAGRSLPLAEHVVDVALAMNFGVTQRLDVGTAFSMVPYQSGLGIDAARSLDGGQLERTALRDPRLGVGYLVLDGSRADTPHLARVRADLTLPLGDATSFASDHGPVLAPGAALVSRFGPLALGVDASLRIKRSVTLADVRHGSQFVVHLGASMDLSSRERLSASFETSWFYGLAGATERAQRSHLRNLPAEWLLGARTRIDETSTLGLYGGGGLPVSAKDVDSNGRVERETFVGLGAPDLRLEVRFVQLSR